MDEDDRLFELLEGYLCALQAGNVAECARLRSLEPGIAKFAKSFEALDSFLPAAPVTLSAPTPKTDGGTP
ncbi:MAG: hypothetical protein NT069_28385, partial [Planctomycetota bacterium]|nr:hypothetical protein [Planctomycetota bacterium]